MFLGVASWRGSGKALQGKGLFAGMRKTRRSDGGRGENPARLGRDVGCGEGKKK